MIASRLVAAAAAAFIAAQAWAHVMSMSNGELRIDGREATLTVDLPLYEVEHLDEPQQAVLSAFSLKIEGEDLPLTQGHCSEQPARASYVCRAAFELPAEAERLEVECSLPDVTVPNHVHVLRAVGDGFADQKVFDYSFRKHEVRFRASSALERFAAQSGAGAVRVLFGPVQLLFLSALAIAARSRKELLWITAAFLAAEVLAAVLTVQRGWLPPARFVEAAGALTVAYIGVEILALPEAGGRWLVAAGMGLFHGLYFGVFLQQSQMSGALVLTGVVLTEALLLVLFALVIRRLAHDFGERLLRNAAAGFLLAVGLVWFGWRAFM